MTKFKIFFIFFLFFLFSLSNVDAAQKYNYVCDNEFCFNTKLDFIGSNYYLNDENKKTVNNFSNIVNSKIQESIGYYSNPDQTIVINDFCEGDCSNDSDLYDKEFTLEELVNY
jgi:hypothetical protein